MLVYLLILVHIATSLRVVPGKQQFNQDGSSSLTLKVRFTKTESFPAPFSTPTCMLKNEHPFVVPCSVRRNPKQKYVTVDVTFSRFIAKGSYKLHFYWRGVVNHYELKSIKLNFDDTSAISDLFSRVRVCEGEENVDLARFVCARVGDKRPNPQLASNSMRMALLAVLFGDVCPGIFVPILRTAGLWTIVQAAAKYFKDRRAAREYDETRRDVETWLRSKYGDTELEKIKKFETCQEFAIWAVSHSEEIQSKQEVEVVIPPDCETGECTAQRSKRRRL